MGGWFDSAYAEEAIEDLNADMAEAMIEVELIDITWQDLGLYSWHDSYQNQTICFPFYGAQNTMLANDCTVDYDPNYFCNIYVIPDMCAGILGWSYSTVSETNSRDGIWLKSSIFGFGSTHPRNDENKVLTHEMGHYCGLHHVFQGVEYCGDGNGLPCDQWGDFVCDTPPTKVQWDCDPPLCPEGLYNYTADNHMDYYPDSCRHHFTEGQIDRMHAKLEYQRAGLFGGDPFCLGDLNEDNVVGTTDLLILLTCWDQEGCLAGDLNNTGTTNVYDLTILLSKYGTFCPGYEPDPFYREERPSKLIIREVLPNSVRD